MIKYLTINKETTDLCQIMIIWTSNGKNKQDIIKNKLIGKCCLYRECGDSLSERSDKFSTETYEKNNIDDLLLY